MPGTMEEPVVEAQVTYDELDLLEKDFEDAELDILRAQHTRFAPLYLKREALISKIPHFWPLVIEQAPPEIDQWIQPSDSKLFAECLTGISVSRFEIDSPKGSPRSFSVTFTFSENPYFEDTKLEKKFWYRQSSEGYGALVSEPVRIQWKTGQDLTMGLTDTVWQFWESKQKAAGKTKDQDLPEYQAMVKKIESVESDAALSFFAWFSFVSSGPFITAEESVAATAKERLDREKQRNGEKIENEQKEVDLDEEDDDIISQIHPAGDDLARLIAEDLWENALQYFADASEQDDEDLSDLDEAMDDEDDSEGEEIDIRALVGKGKKGSKSDGSSTSPPPKKRKT